jgi:hypothetical protein
MMEWSRITCIASETVGQDRNPLWVEKRKHILTASRFGDILKGISTSQDSSQFKENIFIKWGKDHEDYAVKKYSQLTGNEVVQTGLWVFPNGKLGASPDGLVRERSHSEFDGILEIKCPYSIRNFEYLDMVRRGKWPKYFLSSKWDLDKSHRYYHQIQGQLFATRKKWCDFFVWAPRLFIKTRIYPDVEWQQIVLPQLETYYDLQVKSSIGALLVA